MERLHSIQSIEKILNSAVVMELNYSEIKVTSLTEFLGKYQNNSRDSNEHTREQKPTLSLKS
jgi:hypothetical protein